MYSHPGDMSVRESARFAGVNHQTVCNWIEAARLLPRPAEGPDSQQWTYAPLTQMRRLQARICRAPTGRQLSVIYLLPRLAWTQ